MPNENRSARVAMLRISDELRGRICGSAAHDATRRFECAADFSKRGGGGGQGRRNQSESDGTKKKINGTFECSCTQGRVEPLISLRAQKTRRDYGDEVPSFMVAAVVIINFQLTLIHLRKHSSGIELPQLTSELTSFSSPLVALTSAEAAALLLRL